jgi:fatty acyl-CoA reductase
MPFGNGVFHPPTSSVSGTNIFDEVPVGWVANLISLHAAVGTRGVVHAGTESYVPRTFDEMAAVRRNGGDLKVRFVTDRSLRQCSLAQFYKSGIRTRDW